MRPGKGLLLAGSDSYVVPPPHLIANILAIMASCLHDYRDAPRRLLPLAPRDMLLTMPG